MPKPHRKPFYKILLPSSLLLIVPLALFLAFRVVQHARGVPQLEQVKHELLAAGEELNAEVLIPPPTAEARSNGVALIESINTRTGGSSLPEMMLFVSSNKARVLWQESEPRDTLMTTNWEALGARSSWVDGQGFSTAHLTDSAFDFDAEYVPDFDYDADTHLRPLKHLADRFQMAVLVDLHRGDRPAALQHLELLLALPEVLKSEPLVTSQLYRIAMRRLAFRATWEALQFPGWTDEELRRMQIAWQKPGLLPGMNRSFEVERALIYVGLENLRAGDPTIVKPMFKSDGADPESTAVDGSKGAYLAGDIWRVIWGCQAESDFLSASQSFIQSTRRAVEKRSTTEMRMSIIIANRGSFTSFALPSPSTGCLRGRLPGKWCFQPKRNARWLKQRSP